MTIPTIEDLIAPHLAKLRAQAEAKHGGPIARVAIEVRDGDTDYGTRYPYRASIILQSGKDRCGWGNTVDEAIAAVIDCLPALPNLAAILGYEERA